MAGAATGNETVPRGNSGCAAGNPRGQARARLFPRAYPDFDIAVPNSFRSYSLEFVFDDHGTVVGCVGVGHPGFERGDGVGRDPFVVDAAVGFVEERKDKPGSVLTSGQASVKNSAMALWVGLSGRGLKIAADDRRHRAVVGGEFFEFGDVEQAFFFLRSEIHVGAHGDSLLPWTSSVQLHRSRVARWCGAFDSEGCILGQHGETRENGVAVFTTLKRMVVVEYPRHAGERGEFRRQVALRRATDALVHFLERDDVGLFAFDHFRDAQEIDFAVQAFAVLDILKSSTRKRLSLLRKAEPTANNDTTTEVKNLIFIVYKY